MKDLLTVADLNLPEGFIFMQTSVDVIGPTCPICSDCCLCETGGV